MAQPDKKASSPRRIAEQEFRGNVAEFLRQAEQGSSFVITSHDRPVAEIHPPKAMRLPSRRPGGLRDRIVIAPDFDALPEDVLAAMEGGKE